MSSVKTNILNINIELKFDWGRIYSRFHIPIIKNVLLAEYLSLNQTQF